MHLNELRTRLNQAACGMRGHDTLLQLEANRMYLFCVTCGHKSDGWDLNLPPPKGWRPRVLRFHARLREDKKRHAVIS